MTNTPLNPDAVTAVARALNEAGWTCYEGGMEPGKYDGCEDCQEVCNELARKALAAYLAAAQPVVTATIENFINQRPEYITALKGTSGTDDQGDYWRWSGGAEARRQLATMLGWTVPHEPGETTRPEVKP